MVNQESCTRFYTNGVKTIKVKPGGIIPDGYYKGRTFKSNPWNKGLTSKTCSKIKCSHEKAVLVRKNNGSYENPWNKGLTKETDERIQLISDKVSINRANNFWTSTSGRVKTDEEKRKQSIAMRGKPSWNKGLTKETDERIQAYSQKLLGHPCRVTDWEIAKMKEYNTKKTNNSFNISKPEKIMLEELQDKYGIDDVVMQYQDCRYTNPLTGRKFNCDFYVKSLDLFIELNLHWTHGSHPFNADDDNDMILLNQLKLKATDCPQKTSYKYAVKIWSEVDPIKLQQFRDNNLNFMIIYPKGLIIDK